MCLVWKCLPREVLPLLLVVMGAAERGSEESMFAVRGRSYGLFFVLNSDGSL